MDSKTIVSEGKTTNEAIEKGLKILNTSKNNVEIKVLENEEKRSFFSILTPRVVKVEMTIKDEKKVERNNFNKKTVNETRREIKEKKVINLSEKEQEQAINNVNGFFEKLKGNLPEDVKIDVKSTSEFIKVNMESKELGFLIGYRGETLYAFQNIVSNIANKGIEQRVRVLIDIEGYKEKREKTLIDLAEKKANIVIRNKRSIALEPMQAYERKIIHNYLQSNAKVETYSVGDEPYRKLVISLKR